MVVDVVQQATRVLDASGFSGTGAALDDGARQALLQTVMAGQMGSQMTAELSGLQSKTSGCLQTAQMVQIAGGEAQALDVTDAQTQQALAQLGAGAAAGAGAGAHTGTSPPSVQTLLPDASLLDGALPPAYANLQQSSSSCYAQAHSAAADLSTVNATDAAGSASDTAALFAPALASIGVPDASRLVAIFQPNVEAAERLVQDAQQYADLVEEQNITSMRDVGAGTVRVFVRKVADTLLSRGARLDLALENRVTSAELTAPLAGLGVHTTGSTLDTFSYDEMSRCVEHFSPQHTDPVGSTRERLNGEMWMGPIGERKTWLLDSVSLYDGSRNEVLRGRNHAGPLKSLPDVPNGDRSPSSLCHTSYIAAQQTFPATSNQLLNRTPPDPILGRLWEQEVVPRVERCHGLRWLCESTSVWDTLMQRLIYLAAPRYADEPNSTKMPKYFSARPRVIVKDASGFGVAGRNCTVSEVNRQGDFVPITIDYKCGPSGADGVMYLENLSLSNGATRPLQLRVEVNGLEAQLSNDSYWRGAVTVFYLSDIVPSFANTELFFLNGHDSFRLLVLLLLPVFALNGIGLTTPRVNEPSSPVGLITRTLGAIGLLWTMYHATGVLARMHGPSGAAYAQEGRRALTAIGMRDMMPIGAAYSAWDQILRMILLFSTLAVLLLATLALVWSDRSCWRWLQTKLQALQGPATGEEAAAGEEGRASKWRPLERVRTFPDFESMADGRDRASRNHVRLLLRGQRWQTEQLEAAVAAWGRSRFKRFTAKPTDVRAPYDATFFYPQRLWLAFAGSFYVQFVLTLVLFACFDWLVAYVQEAIRVGGMMQGAIEAEAAAPTTRYSSSFALRASVFYTLRERNDTSRRVVSITVDVIPSHPTPPLPTPPHPTPPHPTPPHPTPHISTHHPPLMPPRAELGSRRTHCP